MPVHRSVSSNELGPADESVSEPLNAVLNHVAGRAGLTAKVAAAIVRVASLPEPPLRLLLGTDAVFFAHLRAPVLPPH